MRLWEDGFDHYATNAKLLDGSYATFNGSGTGLSTLFPATGAYGVAIGETGLIEFNGLRKVLPAATDKLGAAARFYFPQLPTAAYEAGIFHFLRVTGTNNAHVTVTVGNNGELHFLRNSQIYQNTSFAADATLIGSSNPVIVAGTQMHVEVQIYLHDTLGWIRAAVNGIEVFEATGIDTKSNSENCAAIAQNRSYISSDTSRFYMDDYYIYDFTGDSAVDTDFVPTTDGTGLAIGFIGELQVMLCVPNGDTAQADWAKSTGTEGFSLIDEIPPVDSDYVYSTAAGDLSEFDLTDLPEEITYIRGVGIHSRISKSDAGAAMYKAGMRSDADTDDADERPVTVEPNYWHDQINVDPDSGARWTRASFNAAQVRITRSV